MECYENGPEGMPPVKRMSDSTIDWVINGVDTNGMYLDEQGHRKLRNVCHAVAEEVLARMPEWPALASQAAPARCAKAGGSCTCTPAERIKCAAAPVAAVPAPTATGTHAGLTNRKTESIAESGYQVVGYVLQNDKGQYCISAQGAVRWLEQPQYWRLMHEQDGSLFATPRSPAAEQFFANLPNESRAAVPAPAAASKHAERANWTYKQWWEHVGARENDRSEICFGTPMAVRAMLIQFGAMVAAKAAAPAQAVDALTADDLWSIYGALKVMGQTSLAHKVSNAAAALSAQAVNAVGIMKAATTQEIRAVASSTEIPDNSPACAALSAQQKAGAVANLTCKDKGGAYVEIGVAAGAGTMRGNLVHVYRDAANGNLFYRTPMDFADRMERAPVATDGPTHDEEAAIRLRAICVRLGIGSHVPQDNATLWGAGFAVLGQIRRALDDEQAQAVPNATRENMALVVARLEQIVATEGEFSANLVDWAKEALPCAEAVAKALNAAPPPQQVALGDSAKDADRNMIIGQAVLHHGCAWPKELSSGVMFFNGQRITKDEFDARALAAALKGGDHANA